MGDAFCSAGTYTPSGLINLYNHHMPKTKPCYNYMEETEEIVAQQEAMRDILSKEVDDYLRAHPNYDPYKDQRLRSRVGGLTAYGQLRERYWINRVEAAGLCNSQAICNEQNIAWHLQQYYDNGQTFWVTEWDASGVNWASVTLDAVGIPLGFVGMGGPLKFGKLGTQVLQITGAVDSAASFEYARRERDGAGMFLSGMSAFPLVGGFFSAMALGRDLGQGNYTYEWIPPIPR